MNTHVCTRREFLAHTGYGLSCMVLPALYTSPEKPNVMPTNSTILSLATFSVDITPPLGVPLNFGYTPPVESIEHPLMAKGVIMHHNGIQYVLCVLDVCALCNGSYMSLRQAVAERLHIPREHVMFHAIHQHTAPVLDCDAMELLEHAGASMRGSFGDYEAALQRSITHAIDIARKNLTPVTSIGTNWAPVDRVASSRRVQKPDGTILARMSASKNPDLRKYPEGIIDGYVRTITFCSDKPVAQLHFYACHPQSFYGDGRISWDVPGIVRERLEKETGIHQMYFNGCGGDITFGKYNDGSLESRDQLCGRLYDGIRASSSDIAMTPINHVAFKYSDIHFPPRTDNEFTREYNSHVLSNTNARDTDRFQAAMVLATLNRMGTVPFVTQCIHVNNTRLLCLPGETLIGYQLHAQCQHDGFVATAAYGDCGLWYIPLDRHYQEHGGYETTWAVAGPSERMYKGIIESLLRA